MVSVALTLALLARFAPQEKAGLAHGRPVAAAPASQPVVALPAPTIEESLPPPPAQPHEWTVLFSSPSPGQTGIARRSAIQVYFNVPVDREVAEWAFDVSPEISGSFSWPRPDRLVFTPRDPMRPGTEYTVSFTPVSASRDGEEYELRPARWTFGTGGARTYQNDIQPLVNAYCARCHAPTGSAAAVPLETYDDVRRYVVPGRATESRFFTLVQQRNHHINMAGPDHSTNTKLAIIKDWINEDRAAR